MSVEKAVHSILEADGTVNALVSTRMYPVAAPQNATLPFLTYIRIGGPRADVLVGAPTLANPSVQVSCWASTYEGAKDLADAVRGALNAYSGTTDSIVIGEIRLFSEGDLMDLSEGLEGSRRYGIRQGYEIWHAE